MNFLDYEVFGLADIYRVLLIVHLFGLALGAGAAFFSDFLFSKIMKDKKVDKTEFGILELTSKVVWIGLAVLVVSGVAIFIGASDRLAESTKFQAKVTIVFILFVNGLVFHFKQIPELKKLIGKDLSKNKNFMRKNANNFFIGGAISGVSWAAALVLGTLKPIDLSYLQIILIYAGVMLLAAGASLQIKKKILG